MPSRGTRENLKKGVKEWIDPTNSSRIGERKRRQEPDSKSLRENDGWMDGWTDGRTDGWMDGWTDGLMDGSWKDGQTDGWPDQRDKDGWMDIPSHRVA